MLAPGTRLGAYEIQALLGVGGMGEVYRARDTRLDRTVAVKVLWDHVAGVAAFRRRFEREARVISSLEHPHICSLFDVGEHAGSHFLVMQYLDGETLADLLRKGPLPVDRAVRHAIEIADALDAAHRQDIIHRDVKPGNVMLTNAGAKLLDFGLAKWGCRASPTTHTSLPTRTELTTQGTILGTFPYMAPEQLEGKETDVRTDIFAFGAVLFEMLTGRRAFDGNTDAALIAAILDRDPPSLTVLRPGSPRALDRLVRRCLAKAPDDRWQSMRDVAASLRWIAEDAHEQVTPGATAQPRSRAALPVVAITAMAVIAAVGILGRSRPAPSRVSRVSLVTPPGIFIAAPAQRSVIAISPTGDRIAYSGEKDGVRHLFLRALDSADASRIAGTEGADSPAFSPDGRWLAFYTAGTLKKVSVSGGAPLLVTSAGNIRGIAWTFDDQLVFANPFTAGLGRVAADGGESRVLTTVNRTAGEKSHRFPQMLPDGRHVLFTIVAADIHSHDDARLAVLDLTTGEVKVVLTGGTHGRYVPTGHLIYARAQSLFAVPFNLETLRITGTPQPVVSGVAMSGAFGTAAFDVAEDGTLAYVSAPETPSTWDVWLVDRTGRGDMLFQTTQALEFVSASPDGSRLVLEESAANDLVWQYDIARRVQSRISHPPGDAEQPAWSSDGLSVVYCTTMPVGVMASATDGSARHRQVVTGNGECWYPTSAPDGSIWYAEDAPGTRHDLWMSAAGAGPPLPVLKTRYSESEPRFSPDGRWVAFTSDESGRTEVYVRPAASAMRWTVSADGGTAPRWARDGRAIYFRRGSQLLAAPVSTGSRLVVEKPRLLFDSAFEAPYDVLPDGRFVMIRAHRAPLATRANLVLNWFAELTSGLPRASR